MRKVRGLTEAGEIPPPSNRFGGTKDLPSASEGLHYEQKVANRARDFGKVKHGQWFKFKDAKGTAYAQTDVLLLPEKADKIYLLESKLTQKAEGELKLTHLYVPLCRHIYKVPIFPILIFKNILWQPDRLLSSFEDIFSLGRAEEGKVCHLHWIGT